jgi:hypothetical protein
MCNDALEREVTSKEYRVKRRVSTPKATRQAQQGRSDLEMQQRLTRRRVTVWKMGICCRRLDICEAQGYISYPRDG